MRAPDSRDLTTRVAALRARWRANSGRYRRRYKRGQKVFGVTAYQDRALDLMIAKGWIIENRQAEESKRFSPRGWDGISPLPPLRDLIEWALTRFIDDEGKKLSSMTF